MSNSAVELLRQQYKQSEDWLVGTMEGVTPEVLSYVPPGGLVSPIAGHLGHILVGLDVYIVSVIGGRDPLFATEFADSGMMSEPPPESDEWFEWGKRVKLDEEAMTAYRIAVFQAVDEILAEMDDDDLAVEREFGSFGIASVAGVFTIMLLNTFSHTGEISAVKGLQGLKGYPM